MRIIPYTDIQIYSDPRLPIVRNILAGLISKTDLKDTYVSVMPDNNMIAICKLTTIYCCNLKECIPGYTIYIDSSSFDPDKVEEYKLSPDEYVAFNQYSSSLYLSIADANQSYFYNLDKYQLIDKIEDITSYDDFKEYLAIRADDGAKFFKGYNNKFIIPIFTKFPNINKSDIANLYVYKFDYESNLIVWRVTKKKFNRDIYTIFRVLTLNIP